MPSNETAGGTKPRYTIGIDLGTTNSVLSYVDHEATSLKPQVFYVEQAVAAGEFQELPALPSFIYMPLDDEKEQCRLPWQAERPAMIVGEMARSKSAEAPIRVVYSSKSWLCNDRIDRHSNCLPASAGDADGIIRISPVMAAQAILEHLRDAWNWKMARENAENRLENQRVVITVPASFDAIARELTVEAATAAGLNFTLLEEPQAAFYAWLAEHDKNWREAVSDGDVILVCDIGGGTTDFSLIAVTGNEGELELRRMAVGKHTLLGGDNIDMTLAMHVASKLASEKNIRLSQYQFTGLMHACRRAKEAIGAGVTGAQNITILGRGAGLFANTITTSIDENDLYSVVMDGFFPKCEVDAELAQGRQSGLRTFSLDYAADPAFTHHLGNFLMKHCLKDENERPMLPEKILFNGGVTKANAFRDRIMDVLNLWRGDNGQCIELAQQDADMSVACGAAWYGHVSSFGGIRIKAGSARSYYVGIESPMPAVPGFEPPVDALCVVNHGMEEGTEIAIAERGMALLVGETSDFRLFTSTVRNDDAIGTRLSDWSEDELEELPPLVVKLKAEEDASGSLVPVSLRTVLTDIGTLQVWCDEIGGDRRWKLEFELRNNETAGSND